MAVSRGDLAGHCLGANHRWQAEQEKILQEIDAADTSQLEPGMGETDLIQALVLQFLQHDGYVETARAFAEDLRVQRQALSLDPEAKVAGINIKDDEDANNRQRQFHPSSDPGLCQHLTMLQEYDGPFWKETLIRL